MTLNGKPLCFWSDSWLSQERINKGCGCDWESKPSLNQAELEAVYEEELDMTDEGVIVVYEPGVLESRMP